MTLDVVHDLHLDRSLHTQGGCVVTAGASAGFWPIYHYHKGVEIALVHAGTVRITAGTWQCLAAPGTAFVLTATTPHKSQPLGDSYTRTHLMVASELVDAHPLVGQLCRSTGYSVMLPVESLERYLWAMQQLQKVLNKNEYSSATLCGLLNLLLWEIAGALERQDQLAPEPMGLICNVICYMSNNLTEEQRLDDLAAHFHISERHLFRVFHKYVGTSPHQYWLNLRLQSARALLQAGFAIKDVARKIGFANVTSFERAFRRFYSINPSGDVCRHPKR